MGKVVIKKSAPVLPYAGTSGWSGSDTSRERAEERDKKDTKQIQREVLLHLLDAEYEGLTWKEIDVVCNINHHGNTSGALSNLHKANRIARLSIKRNRCKIYVHPDYIDGRETEEYGRKK